MKNIINQILIVFSLSSLVACAGTPEDETRRASDTAPRRSDCIREPSIRGYSVLDEQNLLIKASGRRNYHVVLARRAFGLRSSWRISFRSPAGSICEGFSEIMFEGQFDGERIRISSIRELSPEELEAVLIDFGKKEPEIKSTPVPQDVKGADVEELDVDDDE